MVRLRRRRLKDVAVIKLHLRSFPVEPIAANITMSIGICAGLHVPIKSLRIVDPRELRVSVCIILHSATVPTVLAAYSAGENSWVSLFSNGITVGSNYSLILFAMKSDQKRECVSQLQSSLPTSDLGK